MDCQLFSLYVTLKGAGQVSSYLGVPEDDLKKFLPSVGLANQEFFSRVIDCVRDLKVSTDLKATSQYFHIPEEMVRALTEDGFKPAFLNTAKELILGKNGGKCSKGTQTTNDYLKANEITVPQTVVLPFQVPSSSPVFNVTANSATSIPGSQTSQSNHLIQPIVQFHPVPSPSPPHNQVATPSKSAFQAVQTYPSAQKTNPSVPSTSKSPQRQAISPGSALNQCGSKPQPFTHSKKTVNISLLKEHRPAQGTLINPDYSILESHQIS